MEEKNQQPTKTVIIQDKTLRRLAGGFTQVPNFLLRRKDLTPGAKITYSLLLSYAWQEDFCFPAQEQIAKDSGYSERQIRRTLVELKEKGLITWKQMGLNRPNIYTLLPVFEDHGADILSSPDRTSTSGQDRTPMSAYKYAITNTQKDVNVDFSFNGKNGHPTASEEILLADIAAELGDKNPKSKAAFTKVINVLGSEAARQLLSLTKEAHRRGQIRGKKAPYFIGMAKNIAGERGLNLGFGAPLTKRAPMPQDTTASKEAIKNLPPDLQAAFGRIMEKVGSIEAVRKDKGRPPEPAEV